MQALKMGEHTVQVLVEDFVVRFRWGHEAWQQIRLNRELEPLQAISLFEQMPAKIRQLGPDAIAVYLEHDGNPEAVEALQTVPDHVKPFGVRGMRAHVLDMLQPICMVE